MISSFSISLLGLFVISMIPIISLFFIISSFSDDIIKICGKKTPFAFVDINTSKYSKLVLSDVFEK